MGALLSGMAPESHSNDGLTIARRAGECYCSHFLISDSLLDFSSGRDASQSLCGAALKYALLSFQWPKLCQGRERKYNCLVWC